MAVIKWIEDPVNMPWYAKSVNSIRTILIQFWHVYKTLAKKTLGYIVSLEHLMSFPSEFIFFGHLFPSKSEYNDCYKSLHLTWLLLCCGMHKTLLQIMLQRSPMRATYGMSLAGWKNPIDDLVQDCSNSRVLTMELLQSCTKQSIPYQFSCTAFCNNWL